MLIWQLNMLNVLSDIINNESDQQYIFIRKDKYVNVVIKYVKHINFYLVIRKSDEWTTGRFHSP